MHRIGKRIHHIQGKGIYYLLACVALLRIVVPYLFPIHLTTIPNSTLIYDRNAIVIGEIIPDGIHRHQELSLDKYPTFLIDTIIHLEDKRFRKHSGIDIQGLIRAIAVNLSSSLHQ